jgi:hypothetical protein
MKEFRTDLLLGWIAVSISVLFTSLWAFWGIVENFHEGWYFHSLWDNLALMLGQYLIAMLVFLAFALLGLKWPRIGGAVHVLFGCSLPMWFIRNNSGALFLSLPMVVLGIAYWFGRPEPKSWAYRAVLIVPLAVLIAFGAEPAWRVSQRFDDGNLGTQIVVGQGVRLQWAPQGPGWPDGGTTWEEARAVCSKLSADGLSVGDSALSLWRLPTAEELVRSATRHDLNCGGVWDSVTHRGTYQTEPDKESPLWNVHSKVIYWWTANELSDSTALIYVYNGALFPRIKRIKPGYLAFRAVRNLSN